MLRTVPYRRCPNPKQIQNTKDRRTKAIRAAGTAGIPVVGREWFRAFDFRALCFFRISIFGFRA
jgi:hypothetical protein